MPLNVRRYYTFSIFVILLVLAGFAGAQDVTPPPVNPPVQAPTSGDVMRERISKAKAFIAVRNYNAAIYELENIRRESSDPAVQGVVNVLLMNSYLEQGDYKRAQDLLKEFYTQQKTTKANAFANYMAVAGQIVKGARSRVERYRALGLSVSDRTLPLEALNDLEKMRETLELVITQSKELGNDKARSADGMALLEEAGNSRAMLSRDAYDARLWKEEVADTREKLVSSRSVVLNAVTEAPTTTGGEIVAQNSKPAEGPVIRPVVDTKTDSVRDREVKAPAATPPASAAGTNEKPVYIVAGTPPAADNLKTAEVPKADGAAKDGSPLDVGSTLVAYATRKPQPVYPLAARNIRATGVVNVEVTINEAGEVAEVGKASGPSLLQAAAIDAIRKWRFKPFVRDGQPVRANGSVSFNFNL
jgi:TonB family protein